MGTTRCTVRHSSKSKTALRLDHCLNIPGGHAVQTCFPSEEELVKVPTGHGRKYATESLPAICLNPDVKRTETKGSFKPLGSLTLIASSSEFSGFLEDSN